LRRQRGYATALYGKWHLGDSEGRYPNDQGFDEWYGIPNSSDESLWPQDPDFDPAVAHFEYVMEGRRGEETRKVKLYDNDARREIDGEDTDRTIDFVQRSGKAGKPFFAYVPLTQPHMPTEASKAFTGKTGNGPWADMLAEMDYNAGRILDAVSALKIQDNTIVIFSSDNGPEDTIPWRGGWPLVGHLCDRNGRFPPCALHHPLAWQGSRRAGQQRNRTSHRPLYDPCQTGWGRDPHRSRRRWRGSERLPARQTGEIGARVVPSLPGHRL
jgi:arylsulfatase A-like enzyme